MKFKTWPVIIVTLLLLHIGLCTALAIMANSDPTNVIEPEYYSQAVHWDQRGGATWKPTLDVTADAAGRKLTLHLTDTAGIAVDGVTVTLIAFHHAHAADRFSALLTATGEHGVYSATMPLRRAGLWEFRITAKRGGEMLNATERFDLPPATEAHP